MRRFHLIELHEQTWYPDTWRELFQLSLGRANSALGIFDNVAAPFRIFLERIRPDAVLDLCTGSGEMVVSLWEKVTSALASDRVPVLTLSDLYPNIGSFEILKQRHPGKVDFMAGSVNALHPPPDAPRVWTLFESLHHFRPHQVRDILRNASENSDGIAVFEGTRRSLGTILQVLVMLPVMSIIFTAFLVRPVRFRNLLWGLFVPVVPMTIVFDAIVSNLRTYTVEELEEMTRSIDNPDFRWEIGSAEIPRSGGLRATYLFGWNTRFDPPTADDPPGGA